MSSDHYKWHPHKRQNKGSTSKTEPTIDLTVNREKLPANLNSIQHSNERWCTMPAVFADYYGKLYDMEVRHDDVFIVTFPKSGTTWTQEAVWLLMNDLNYEATETEYLKMRSPFLDLKGIYPQYVHDTVELASRCKSPRVLKSHLPAHLLPHQIWEHKNKIIYCARNLKDVVVSFYPFLSAVHNWSGDMDTFVRDFICSDLMYTPFWDNILDFWQLSQQESHIFFNTYERMKADLPGVLQDLCKFLERPALTSEEMEKLVKHLSFENMKSNDNFNPLKEKNHRPNISPDFEFMRRGIVGAYKDELSIENQQLLDAWSQKFLKERQIKLSDIWGDLI